jgi:4-hydroxy-3-polyprenylbenzoate decarboxylase
MEDLRDFIALLEEAGELARIKVPVSRELEITEITDRVCKGPPNLNRALLFERVEGSSIPVAINLFGSERRMAMALRVQNLKELEEKVSNLLSPELPSSLAEALKRGKELAGVLKSIAPRPKILRKKAPCQEVIRKGKEANLLDLPILKCWPKDAGYYITLPQVITLDPLTGRRNVGMYRLQVVDERTLLVHWQRHKGGAEHSRKALDRGLEQIPAAVVLGGDPAAIWCASAPLPQDVDEYLLAGWLRGKPLELAPCLTQPLEVPAMAEIVIEGFVDLRDLHQEGPFGDHTGYYTPPELFPAFHVTAITSRQDPIYPATVVGVPPMEDYWMGQATERLFLPLIRLVLPEVVDLHMPAAGVFHNLVLVSIRKRYPGHARKVIFGLWGMGLMMLAKAIVVVDEWVDVRNLEEVAWYALGNVDWKRDVVIVEGPVDQLDHAASQPCFGGKIGIDATAKLPEEGHNRPWPEVAKMSPEVNKMVDEKWPEILKALGG